MKIINRNKSVVSKKISSPSKQKLKKSYQGISKRKNAVEAMRTSEEKFRSFFENSMDAMLVTNPNRKILSANPAACKMFGYSEKELIKLRRSEVVDNADLKLPVLLAERSLNGKAYGELVLIKKDGTHFTADISSSVFKDSEGIECTSMIIRDITGRKRADEELRNSEKKFRNLFENSLVGITTASPDGRLIETNITYAQMYGYNNPEEMMSEVNNVGQLYVNQEDRKEVLRILTEKGFMGPREIEVIKRDGTRFFSLVSSREFIDESSNLIYYQATHLDITEQKKVHEEIIGSKKQLEELYKHLNDVRENERAEISREIHDELGQTLTALKIDLNWTMEKIPADVLIHKKIKSMIDMVSGTIKKVQKISSDLRPGMLDDLGLNASLEWYSKECEKRSNFTCMLELDEIPNLNSKIKLILFRIFQEGMTNIIRHANAKKVDVKLNFSSSGIILKISDDGIGISKKKTNMKDSLGLIGIKERLRQFNGTLEIISSINNGTSLVINIPIVEKVESCTC